MNKRMIEILIQNYGENYCELSAIWGLPISIHYDALIVSPVWTPDEIFLNEIIKIIVVSQHRMISSYIVEYLGKRVAWIKCVPGSCNLIDVLGMSVALVFDKMFFVGTVGSLSKNSPIGDICTPQVCVSGCMSEAYLLEDPSLWKPFQTIVPNDMEFVDKVCNIKGFSIKNLEYSALIRSFSSEAIWIFWQNTKQNMLRWKPVHFIVWLNFLKYHP